MDLPLLPATVKITRSKNYYMAVSTSQTAVTYISKWAQNSKIKPNESK